MTPSLLAVSGPLKGATYEIPEGESGIGRTIASAIVIEDGAVSRNHCVLRRSGEECLLRDLGSHNRTYVNGIPIDEKRLEHGDEIRIGRSVFLYASGRPFAARDLLDGDTHPDLSGTIVLRPEDSIYRQSAPQNVRQATNDRVLTNFRSLLKAGELMSTARHLSAFAEGLLSVISDAIPAQIVVILLAEDLDREEDWRQFAWTRRPNQQIRFPRGIIRKVLLDRVSVLSNDVLAERSFNVTDSIVESRMKAVAAAPLVACGRTLGAIAASTETASSALTKEDLELLTGIGGVVAGGLETLLQLEALEAENRRLQDYISAASDLVGASPAMQSVQKFVWKVASSSSTVLITGESGTGKELVARALHRNSPRADRPFIAINCAALSESLIESELFGHEKGAFTGAITQKKGKLEEADHGTLFLDEIGELAPALQAKLLRVLQEREFERVGSTKVIRIDIRLLAATNRNLAEMVQQGSFRQDLFYRLNVVSIGMPALRNRREDIPVLAQYFLEKLGEHAGRKITGFTKDAIETLKNHDWPGNVRELQNVVERAIVLGSGPTIVREDFPESLLETIPSTGASGEFHELVNDAKRRIIITALDSANGNYTEAAKQLGIHANNLHRLVRTLGVKRSAAR
ncbi:MAG TPA: sigma 54-interacting transcriptional regulator [Bryobacteraceae bacterium]|nr:sigma 54-interacting transcriptional regulator [Bryobacteraceae bacterium]